MDNTALELTSAILWTLGVFALPTLALFVAGAVNLYVFGNTAQKSGEKFLNSTSPNPFEAVSETAKKGALTMIVGLIVALALAVLAIWQAVEAWVSFAS